MLKKLFITILFASLIFAQGLSGNCLASEVQCMGREFPMIDEGSKDASFKSFRENLLKAVRERDAGYIKNIVDPEIILSYADKKSGKASISGIVNFSDMHKPQNPNSPFWKTLETILSMGGSFKDQNREIFEAPYVHSNWPEGCSKYWYRAVIGKNAAVYSEPDANSQVIARLSYCIVQMLKTDSEIWQKTDSEIWQKIIMPDRKEGYVSKESVRSYYDYSVRFEKKSGKWLMTIFAELPEQRRIPYPPP